MNASSSVPLCGPDSNSVWRKCSVAGQSRLTAWAALLRHRSRLFWLTMRALASAICPESFSFTLSEVFSMGLPVVAFAIGSQGHRVQQYPKGVVCGGDTTPQQIVEALYRAACLQANHANRPYPYWFGQNRNNGDPGCPQAQRTGPASKELDCSQRTLGGRQRFPALAVPRLRTDQSRPLTKNQCWFRPSCL